MVHVRKCPCEYGRGRPTTEFYKNGKPQIYCHGWIDQRNDEPMKICINCKDFAGGEQCEYDYEHRND